MKKQTALIAICIVSIIGLLFSGYLSYSEIFAQTCGIDGCGASIGVIPACVYGFFMYLILLIISVVGLTAKN
jgi:uncharacterized membrane protein